jgi:uncharacterized protein
MAFSSSENPPHLNECPNCQATLLGGALYCGQCGCPTSHGQKVFTLDGPITYEHKLPWQWISPAIGLWVILLAINGLLCLSGHVFDISSPYFDLGAQGLSASFILIFCVKSRKQIKPLLQHFGFRGALSYFEIVGALIFLLIFMWFYLKIAAFIGIEDLSYLKDFRNHNWPIWSAFILLCIMPGIFEELAFRGYIMTRIEKVSNTSEALIIQAAMFSILHMLPASFISHFVIGIALGIVRIRSKSLYPGIFVHTGWNAIIILGEVYKIVI